MNGVSYIIFLKTDTGFRWCKALLKRLTLEEAILLKVFPGPMPEINCGLPGYEKRPFNIEIKIKL